MASAASYRSSFDKCNASLGGQGESPSLLLSCIGAGFGNRPLDARGGHKLCEGQDGRKVKPPIYYRLRSVCKCPIARDKHSPGCSTEVRELQLVHSLNLSGLLENDGALENADAVRIRH